MVLASRRFLILAPLQEGVIGEASLFLRRILIIAKFPKDQILRSAFMTYIKRKRVLIIDKIPVILNVR